MATSIITSNAETISSEHYRSEKHTDGVLNHLYSREDLFDVVLIATEGSKRISAHRLILVGCSDYFSAMFTASLQDKTTSKKPTQVTVDDVAGKTLQDLITFCYTGNLEIREDSVTSLLRAAVLLKLNEVVEACCGFLQRHLKHSNCLSIAFAAKQQNIEGLLQNATEFICDNFVEVYQQQEFLLLSSVQLSQILSSDDFKAPSEDVVHAVIKWIEHDPEKRTKHLTEFLSLIPLHLIKPETLLRKVLPYCCAPESKDLILQALKDQLPPESDCQKKQVKQEQRKQILFITREDTSNKIGLMSYCPLTGKYTRWNTSVEAPYCFRCVSMDENLILVGEKGDETVISLNLRYMESETLSPTTMARFEYCMAVLNDSIYVIGGEDGSNNTLSSVERWDPKTRSWSDVAAMKECRAWAEATALNGCIYVSGGYNRRRYLSTVECYDPNQNLWTTIESMNSPRRSHALQEHNGLLYAIGGLQDDCTTNQCIERYNPSTKKWTKIQCSLTKPGLTKSVALESDIFIRHDRKLYKYTNNGHIESLQLEELPFISSIRRGVDMVTIPDLTILERFIRH